MNPGLKNIHRYIYFFGIALVAASLPLSKVTMSSGEIILFGNWIVEGHFKNKFRTFFNNKTALVISSLFLLHIIGLIYTTDFNYGIFDLRVKVPMLLLPLIVSTTEPLRKKQFQNLLLLFVAAVLASTFFSMFNYLTKDFVDIREICAFISHIRLSLMICLSIFILSYFLFSGDNYSKTLKLVFAIIIIWFAVFLVILESITGLSILFTTAFILGLISLFKMKNKLYKMGIVALIIVISSLVVIYFNNIYKDYSSYSLVHKSEVRKVTAQGNPYSGDSLNLDTFHPPTLN